METFTLQILAILLVSIRFAPIFAYAAPFTLMRVPVTIRILLAVSLATWLVLSNPADTYQRLSVNSLWVTIVLSELFLGVSLALALQWAQAAILTAGRTIDIQAGYGLALLADPTSRAQIPLIGTVFAYMAGAIFFSIGGGTDILVIFAQSLERVPLASGGITPNLGLFLNYLSAVFILAIGLAGVILLTLFLIDMTVAFLSRTLPQMNVLLIGFQVKTMAVLFTLPLAISLTTATYVRIVRLSLQTTAQMY